MADKTVLKSSSIWNRKKGINVDDVQLFVIIRSTDLLKEKKTLKSKS